MSKGDDWVKKNPGSLTLTAREDGREVAYTAWCDLDGSLRVDTLGPPFGPLAPKEALRFARWLLDIYGDGS